MVCRFWEACRQGDTKKALRYVTKAWAKDARRSKAKGEPQPDLCYNIDGVYYAGGRATVRVTLWHGTESSSNDRVSLPCEMVREDRQWRIDFKRTLDSALSEVFRRSGLFAGAPAITPQLPIPGLGGRDDTAASAQAGSPQATPPPTMPSLFPTVPLPQPPKPPNIQFSVNAVSSYQTLGQGFTARNASPGHAFMVVDLSVYNGDSKEVYVTASDFGGIGSDGKVYSYCTVLGMAGELSARLLPGGRDRGYAVYEVPQGITIDRVRYEDTGW